MKEFFRRRSSAGFVTRLTYWDVTDGEQADPRVAVHRPLLRLTVGLTAVVHEARVVSFRTGVDDPVLQRVTEIRVSDSFLLERVNYYKICNRCEQADFQLGSCLWYRLCNVTLSL